MMRCNTFFSHSWDGSWKLEPIYSHHPSLPHRYRKETTTMPAPTCIHAPYQNFMYPTLLYEWSNIYPYPYTQPKWNVNKYAPRHWRGGKMENPEKFIIAMNCYWWRWLEELNRGPWLMASPEMANNSKFPHGSLNSRSSRFSCYSDIEAIRPSP